MALQDAVQGSTHIGQMLTWTLTDGSVLDLTGATLSGSYEPPGGIPTAISGALTVQSPATAGVFAWAYSAADVATPGYYTVQFVATYSDLSQARSFAAPWIVLPKQA